MDWLQNACDLVKGKQSENKSKVRVYYRGSIIEKLKMTPGNNNYLLFDLFPFTLSVSQLTLTLFPESGNSIFMISL